MSDISEFTSVFRARVNINDKRKANKRNRASLSCLTCRNRKLKCDRNVPCSTCVKRGESANCSYGPGAVVGGITKPSGSEKVELKKAEAQARLRKLEELVQNLIQNGGPHGGPLDANKSPNLLASKRNGSLANGNGAVTSVPEEGAGTDTPDISETTPSSRKSQSEIPSTASTSPTEDSDTPSSQPQISMSYDGTSGSYAGATHWSALLDQIQGLKASLAWSSSSEEADQDGDHPSDSRARSPPPTKEMETEDVDIIMGSQPHWSGAITLSDAIAALPTRASSDRLVSIYYGNKYCNALFIHTTQFRREYEAFWKNPHSVSLIWLSIFYSILCLGSITAFATGKVVGLQNYDFAPKTLASKARQCLIAGQAASKERPHQQRYLLESLVFYAYCKFQLTKECDSNVWAVGAYMTRLAQRLGYHRDPKYLGIKFTPFEAEMRRRTWFWISTFDLLSSYRYGMPAIIQDEQCDTDPPRNLMDEDFDIDSKVLPEGRPETEFTQMLYYAYKIRITVIFRKVIRHCLALKMPDYEETEALEKELTTAHASIPAVIAFGNSIRDASFSDTPQMILHRMSLELTYHKCRCVLHRGYLTYDRENPRYLMSREAARDSAMRILEIQHDAHEECRPGGRMFDERWMLWMLTLHDFLLASMIMCLDLGEKKRMGLPVCEIGIVLIKKSYKIFYEQRHARREAFHAANALSFMYTKLAGLSPEHTSLFPSESTSASSNGTTRSLVTSFTTPPSSAGAEPQAAAIASDLVDQGARQMFGIDSPSLGENDGGFEFMPMEFTDDPFLYGNVPLTSLADVMDFDTMMVEGGNIDWGMVDQYLFDQNMNVGHLHGSAAIPGAMNGGMMSSEEGWFGGGAGGVPEGGNLFL